MTLTLVLLLITIGGRRGFWTMFVLASSLLVFWSAKSALTDAVLLLFITISQLCVYAIWRGRRSWWVFIALGASIGLGGLTKGPIVLGVPVATLIALWILSIGSRRRLSVATASVTGILLKALIGLLVLAAVVSPWLYLVHQRCPDFLSNAIHKQVIDRAANAQEGHSGPPGYYLITIWVMFFPWSLLLPATIVCAWRHRHLPQVRFALAAFVGPWLMLECISTKLPHYLLPAYPFLAYLTADLLIRSGRKRIKDLVDKRFVRIVGVWAGIVVGVGAAPWALWHFFPLDRAAIFGLLLFTVLCAEYGRNVYVAFRASRPLIAAGVMGAGMFVLVIVLHIGFLPAAGFLQVSRQLAEIMKANGATAPADEIMIDYKEPSLAFYQGGTIREESRNDYLTTVNPVFWPRWIVVTDDVLKKTPPDRRAMLVEIGSVHGLDYAGRGLLDVKVMRREP
jgi:4-amino-4-deoxy-L-arabinose transferase-like glycosyltransferase